MKLVFITVTVCQPTNANDHLDREASVCLFGTQTPNLKAKKVPCSPHVSPHTSLLPSPITTAVPYVGRSPNLYRFCPVSLSRVKTAMRCSSRHSTPMVGYTTPKIQDLARGAEWKKARRGSGTELSLPYRNPTICSSPLLGCVHVKHLYATTVH